jgi:hypothetical protein
LVIKAEVYKLRNHDSFLLQIKAIHNVESEFHCVCARARVCVYVRERERERERKVLIIRTSHFTLHFKLHNLECT